ncbi:MAG: hypothetical protein L6R37_002335 [Teloschistes peruensis]|nr:MAG: hypothetical protein L6R37_002335 [Teloschistes peruensis]
MQPYSPSIQSVFILDLVALLNLSLQAFSQADNATINVLDHRAATYEKLGNLQAALADGRRMIRLSKTSCVGYLRTGKILLLLKENKKARDIYDLGCRNTNSSDPHYEAPLLAKIPEVRKLVLKNLQGLDAISSPDVVAMTHLEELRLRDCYGILYPQALPSLRILRVCGHRVLIQPSSHSEIPGYRGPSLVELTLKDNHFSDMLLISRLLGSRSGTLRTLKISGCNRVNLSWLLVKIMQRGALDEVVDLDLGATDVTDQAIEISTPTLRNLRCISLDRTNVTGIAVKALILKPGTKLEYLGISECDRISADAVEFARKQPGLTLKSGSNSDAKGRKVRYG